MPYATCPSHQRVERHRQLQRNCIVCNETLFLRSCGIESSLHLFRDGGFFIHRGAHTHPTFTHSSVHIPDGSLAFIDFTPKYVISSDVGAAASAPQDTVFNSRPPLLITALAPLNGRVSQTMLYCAGV
ncbi:hypothetical protein B0H17DRAFT_345094 [Mycena rosella]|uniref:Uncharacterized protein n=1 Tax=Mycena rosella TaxID=1033263 RepID=A0AAD7CQW9_MYCRO|nr:hypothetical protein B0H17DRAFT_345094 [Mycena rosella]